VYPHTHQHRCCCDHHGLAHRLPRSSIPIQALTPGALCTTINAISPAELTAAKSSILMNYAYTFSLEAGALSLAKSEACARFTNCSCQENRPTGSAPTSRLDQSPQFTCYAWQLINLNRREASKVLPRGEDEDPCPSMDGTPELNLSTARSDYARYDIAL
jgi:hypothetical protein